MPRETLPDGKLTKKGRSLSDYVFWLLLFVLALKALGLTKVWFNIDPYGFNVSFDIGSAISLVLFGLVWQKQDTLTTTLSKQGERLANLEGRLQPTKSQ